MGPQQFLSGAFLWLTLFAPGQAESALEYARRVDQSISRPAEDAPPCYCSELTLNQQGLDWPVVGHFQVHYRFYSERPFSLLKVVGRREFGHRWEERQVWFREEQPLYFVRTTPEGAEALDLGETASRRIQEAQREAGEMLRVFRQFQLLP